MNFKSLWQRYIFWGTFKVFCFFLAGFYFLYALIDYSTHMQDFIVDKRIHFSHIFYYYGCMFIKRADLLIPLALLIAMIKQLLSMMLSKELVALQASGISLKKIVRPFLFLAVLCSAFNYCNFEFFLPSSLNFLDLFKKDHFRHSRRGVRSEPVHALHLKDGSKILYQTNDAEKGEFLDVFWVRSINDIWKMKTLSSNPLNPVGTYVDHIERNKEGNLTKTESFTSYTFSRFKWEPDLAGKGYIPNENRKMSELFNLLMGKRKITEAQRPQILAHLLFKSVMPLLSLLVVIGIFPYCVRYNRTIPSFAIYAFALFGFIAFTTVMDGSIILAENTVLSPFIALIGPFCLSFLGFGWKFAKII